ncbi:outer membrane beta-barrel protein [Paraglaciecola chathamensis]|uniref:outer membrane beta-barrel protein n=1 Tax=Paraglaciecola chathamensis TaxID=368405 RepID=UPI0026F93B5C|nr:outer membrane beta-barrel protein [Paraglaciecola chathamensis]MDO6558263.1 outer membrane beta-barrel protein [Paraglaciecola chathamensis]MDO6838872.1 outer membrane beta-barrel protein [Paraglaciecola chathamensis]
MSVNTAPIIRNKVLIAVALACGSASSVGAGEIKIAPSITTSGYYYNTEIGAESSEATEAVALIPQLVSIYNGRNASASVVVTNTTVEQRSALPESDKSFTELSYNASVTLIENVLSLSLYGNHEYRAIDASQNLVSDKVLASGGLTKTKTDGAQLQFITPNPKKVGILIRGGFSQSKSDDALVSQNGVNGKNTFVNASLYQGNDFKGLSFLLSTQINDTKREFSQDFSSNLTNARISFNLLNDVSFVLIGSDSDYGLDESEFEGNQRQNLDTTSYGAGFTWQSTDENSIEITYNQLEEDDTSTRYVGLNTQWAFSERTAMQFTYGKRFYGDAYTFSLDYKLKSFSASASYLEDVTSYSRLSFEEGPSSLFVCPIGSIDFAECFQTSSGNYVLQAGEEFRNLNSFTTDITDETLFRKTGRINLGYDKRKLKAALSFTYNTTEYFETNREQTSNVTSLLLSYQMTRRNTLGLTASYSKVDFNDTERTDDVINLTANFNRKLSRQLTMDVSARYVERETEDENRDLTDSRLTVSLNYQF